MRLIKSLILLIAFTKTIAATSLDYESDYDIDITNFLTPNLTQIPLCLFEENKCCQYIEPDRYPYVCRRCDHDCPCLCKSKGNGLTGSYMPSMLNQQQQQQIRPSQLSISSDISFSAYTLILSIGLPTITIILIIFTLLGVTYCCKSSANSIDNENINNNPPISVSNISLVYINLDENNNNNNSNQKIPSKEQPPRYSDYVNGSVIDKLPSYQSFRTNSKKINEADLNAKS